MKSELLHRWDAARQQYHGADFPLSSMGLLKIEWEQEVRAALRVALKLGNDDL